MQSDLTTSVEIPLYRGLGAKARIVGHALVDAVDAPRISSYRWGYNGRYAQRSKGPRGSSETLYMHCIIFGSKGVDHINRNTLDNRRSNLRGASHAQNMQNQPARKTSTSTLRGVSWSNRDRRWTAQGMLAGKNYWLGHFDTEQEAGIVAAEWRRQHMPFSVD